jgi:fumarate hydratase class II
VNYRIETDSLGEVQVPEAAYYGAQTQRAVENFPISSLRFPRRFIRALGLIKRSCAQANLSLGILQTEIAEAIIQSADEVISGDLDKHFVVDIFQTGSGTSTNMNANEVIANRSIERLGGQIGSKKPVHPNDHVNNGQSSNDVIPTAIHIAAREALENDLLPALSHLLQHLEEKAKAFDPIVKIGRTHLQDAVPIRLGQEFGSFASQISHGIQRVKRSMVDLEELALGGTAVGTGLNRLPEFPGKAIDLIRDVTGIPFRPAENAFEALAARDASVSVSGALKTIACSLMKIANDLRWLSSGPRCGLGEIELPSQQPGSSIMPGKINPVLPEAICMIAAQVIGNDAAITVGGQSGNFELNVMKPVIAHNLLESIEILARGCQAFTDFCIKGIQANQEQCESYIEQSLSMCTALAPHIGYDQAADIAKTSFKTGKTVREIATERASLPENQLSEVLNAFDMTNPGIPGK